MQSLKLQVLTKRMSHVHVSTNTLRPLKSPQPVPRAVIVPHLYQMHQVAGHGGAHLKSQHSRGLQIQVLTGLTSKSCSQQEQRRNSSRHLSHTGPLQELSPVLKGLLLRHRQAPFIHLLRLHLICVGSFSCTPIKHFRTLASV